MLKNFFSLVLIILLAILWLLFASRPVALAQDKTINYSFAQLQDRDFSHQDLRGGVFAAAAMRGVNLEGADLSYSILTEAVLLKANSHVSALLLNSFTNKGSGGNEKLPE